MTKAKIVNRKELLKKINEVKRKERRRFLMEANDYLKGARFIVNDKSPQK